MTAEIAPLISAEGWRNTFTTATPFSDCDSMCSMPLTVVVSDRSKIETMRLDISDGTRPVYVQMTLITGMLIAGKMSTGVRSSMTGLIRNNRSASTMNVYGRRNASFTIHIETSR